MGRRSAPLVATGANHCSLSIIKSMAWEAVFTPDGLMRLGSGDKGVVEGWREGWAMRLSG